MAVAECQAWVVWGGWQVAAVLEAVAAGLEAVVAGLEAVVAARLRGGG